MRLPARSAFFAAIAAAAWLVASGCAERRTPIEIAAHPVEWNQTLSVDFHGTRVVEQGVGNCATCHGADLAGDAAVPGCDDCHVGAGGHPFGWADPNASRFHGDAVRAGGLAQCRVCHGADDAGGWSGVGCAECHAGGPSGHPDGWMERGTSSFHGLRMMVDGVATCTPCHGRGLGGGTSGLACGTCHEVVGAGSAAWRAAAP